MTRDEFLAELEKRIDLETIVHGTQSDAELASQLFEQVTRCTKCDGNGAINRAKDGGHIKGKCWHCHGTGSAL